MSGLTPGASTPAADYAYFTLIPPAAYVSMLTLEDGTIVSVADGDAADADTYVDLAYVLAYATRYGSTWSTADSLASEQAILRAMIFIEGFEDQFAGSRVSELQVLSWPRQYVPNMAGNGYLSSTSIPLGLKNALAEAAILEQASPFILTPTVGADDRYVIKERKKVGPLEKEIQYSEARSDTSLPEYTRIMAFLKPFFEVGQGDRVVRA